MGEDDIQTGVSKYGVAMWNGFNWPSRRTSGRLLWIPWLKTHGWALCCSSAEIGRR